MRSKWTTDLVRLWLLTASISGGGARFFRLGDEVGEAKPAVVATLGGAGAAAVAAREAGLLAKVGIGAAVEKVGIGAAVERTGGRIAGEDPMAILEGRGTHPRILYGEKVSSTPFSQVPSPASADVGGSIRAEEEA
jgi:hypothetical protein